MIHGDGLVQLREIDRIMGWETGRAWQLMKTRQVFAARKLHNGVWAVREEDVPYVCDRLIRYKHKLPIHPLLHMTPKEAAVVLQVRLGTVYAMASKGMLEWAPKYNPATDEGEVWKMVTKVSVNHHLNRRGMRQVS